MELPKEQELRIERAMVVEANMNSPRVRGGDFPGCPGSLF